MPRCGGLEELPGEEASVTKSEVQSAIQLVFSNQINFIADMTARAGMCGNRNRSTAGVEIVICSGQPVAFKCLFELPFLGRLFFYAHSELHKVSAPDLIHKAELVVIRRIELVKGVPLTSIGAFCSRGVVTFGENTWRRGNLAKRFPRTRIACPGGYGGCSERASLPVKFGVVVEVSGKRTLPVEADGDFIEVPTPERFRKSRARGGDAPENIGFEDGFSGTLVPADATQSGVAGRVIPRSQVPFPKEFSRSVPDQCSCAPLPVPGGTRLIQLFSETSTNSSALSISKKIASVFPVFSM